jgi:hypothetical protein
MDQFNHGTHHNLSSLPKASPAITQIHNFHSSPTIKLMFFLSIRNHQSPIKSPIADSITNLQTEIN